jgi:anti-sigma factor RsiW
MTCDKAREVHAYHDGQLDAHRATVLETHLQGCPGCQALLTDLRSLSQVFARAALPAMPDHLMARFEDSWQDVAERAQLRIVTWMTGVAAALLVGALLMWSSVRNESATRALAADPVVLATAAEPPGEPNSELIQVAQWMADDLSIDLNGPRR